MDILVSDRPGPDWGPCKGTLYISELYVNKLVYKWTLYGRTTFLSLRLLFSDLSLGHVLVFMQF